MSGDMVNTQMKNERKKYCKITGEFYDDFYRYTNHIYHCGINQIPLPRTVIVNSKDFSS